MADGDATRVRTQTPPAPARVAAAAADGKFPAEKKARGAASSLVDAATTMALKTTRKLLHFHELEEWRQDNEWIVTGYRVSDGSYASCFQSLLYIHNETGNIYSHLLGGVIFVAITFYTYAYILGESFMDRLIFGVFLACALMCFFSSSLFHTVCSHSLDVSKMWNKCDYVGITFMIVGSSYPTIYYAFHCHANEQLVYLTFMTIFGLLSLPLILLNRFSQPEWRTARALLYVAMGASGILPMFHLLYLRGWMYAVTFAAVDWCITMGAFYLGGAFLYGSRIPERHYPGKFDFWFHSHQIFHICVLVAALLHYVGLVNAYNWHQVNECTSTEIAQHANDSFFTSLFHLYN